MGDPLTIAEVLNLSIDRLRESTQSGEWALARANIFTIQGILDDAERLSPEQTEFDL